MVYDCIVVGGGMAGLTSAAYLSRAGLNVLIVEKEQKVGGLVSTFEYEGCKFDGGIRALENSGIILPMLRHLGIEMDLISNDVTIGIGDDLVRLKSKESLSDYETLLNRVYPGNESDIRGICNEISRVMRYMDILYGIDNPLFLDIKKDKEYLLKTILPWMGKFMMTIPKIGRLNMPVDEYLQKFTKNRALIDIIAQHFFKATPTFFALSYFSLYLDYKYPVGGTGSLARLMEKFVIYHGGQIMTGTEITGLNPAKKTLQDGKGQEYRYRKLLWAADMRKLYSIAELEAIEDAVSRGKAIAHKDLLSGKAGGDSILTLYLVLNTEPSYISGKSSPHFFYTPDKRGLSAIDHSGAVGAAEGYGWGKIEGKDELKKWLRRYLELTTYEISCPVLRDGSMAPKGKTGLIVSSLMDYKLVERIRDEGWYEEFKSFCERTILDVLSASVYPGLGDMVASSLVSTPLTLARLTGNSEGAITGWAFTNSTIPAVSGMPKVASAVKTPIPDVLQAGQWTFSPSGLPISILTGKLAADSIIRQLKKKSAGKL